VIRDSRRGQSDEPDLLPNLFIVGLLRDLKARNYSWRAWTTFLRDSWVRSVQIIDEHADLRASWARTATVGAIVILLATAGVLQFAGLSESLWFLATSLIWWAVLMTDLGLHLGLMVNLETGELRRTIGLPNLLTEIRAFSAVWVAWGAHWAGAGAYLPLLIVFAAAAVSDLLDGWLARRRHAATRWGRLYDPFMDGVFFSVAAISLAVIHILPEWLAAVVVLRYAFPVVGAIVFLVVRQRTLKVRHTAWGRASSASIAIVVFAAAAASVLHIPFWPYSLALYALLCVTAVGAFITILMKGIEQA
jgi:phosphatidylglycerophosphate synthase